MSKYRTAHAVWVNRAARRRIAMIETRIFDTRMLIV
jgi:hypothetical protein